MAFTVNDLQDLMRLLGERPEWRAQLRPLILGDDLDRLPRIVQELAEAQQRTEARVLELAEAQRRTEVGLTSLGQKIDELVATVKALSDQFTQDTGALYEIRFERKAPSLFGEWLRKPRVVTLNDLDRFDEAEASGQLTKLEAGQLRALDMIVSGFDKREPGFPETLLAVEVSRTIDESDLDRATGRADLLTKIGYRALPAVGGKFATDKLLALAAGRNVLIRLIDQTV